MLFFDLDDVLTLLLLVVIFFFFVVVGAFCYVIINICVFIKAMFVYFLRILSLCIYAEFTSNCEKVTVFDFLSFVK